MATRSKSTDIEIKDKQQEEQDLMNKDVVDIEFKELQKKRFRLDRDNSRVIELNVSDISVLSRAEEFYPKLLKLVEDARVTIENGDAAGEDNTSTVLDQINNDMKGLINYIFDSEVADKACPSGTLFDPINGKFRFEYIMERLIGLYGENISKEFDLVQKRVNKHTSKYTKKRK